VGFFVLCDIYIKRKLVMRKIVKLTESDLNRLVKRILKEEDELSTTTASSEKAMVDKHISKSLLDFLRLSVSWVGREETSNLLEKVISKLMDYENKDISSDYNLDFDWIRDVVREMEAPLEIGARKNREKNDFDLEQRGYTKNKY
jgi:hypothetical protein